MPGETPAPGVSLAVIAGADYELWGKKLAIPWRPSPTPDGEQLATSFSRTQLSRAPEFKEGLSTADEASMGEIYRFYGIQPSCGPALEEMNPGTVNGYRYDYYWPWE